MAEVMLARARTAPLPFGVASNIIHLLADHSFRADPLNWIVRSRASPKISYSPPLSFVPPNQIGSSSASPRLLRLRQGAFHAPVKMHCGTVDVFYDLVKAPLGPRTRVLWRPRESAFRAPLIAIVTMT